MARCLAYGALAWVLGLGRGSAEALADDGAAGLPAAEALPTQGKDTEAQGEAPDAGDVIGSTGSSEAPAATEAKAEDEPFHWKSEYARVGWPEYIATPLLLLSPTLDERLFGRVEKARWRGPILFDAALHNDGRARSESDRDVAGEISDRLLQGGAIATFVVDNVLVAWALRGSLDTAWQMTVINAQAVGLTNLVTRITKRAFARERPYGQECSINPDFVSQCSREQRYRSFISGHSSSQATFAGLSCAHHLELGIYGNRTLDVAACAGSVALMLTTGALRLVSSNHWATDIVGGGVVGFSIGYFMPKLLYYDAGRNSLLPGTDAFIAPLVTPTALGLTYMGRL